jgi:hypothetical protein
MPPEFQTWAESVSLWQVIGWSAGIIAFVGFIVFMRKKGWPWILGTARAVLTFARVVDAVQGLPDFIERTDSTLQAQNLQIADIHHEVHYNNGTSVKDGVQRVETGLAAVHAEVATVALELAQAKEALTLSDARTRQDLEERRAVEDTRNEDGTPKRT